MSKDRRINNPATGSTDPFGVLPEFKVPGTTFQSGPIYLCHGEHRGPNRGYGFVHIWAEHFSGIKDSPTAEEVIAKSVLAILGRGSKVLYEGGTSIKASNRAIVCRHGSKIVVLEAMDPQNGERWYSVVTSYVRPGVKGKQVANMP